MPVTLRSCKLAQLLSSHHMVYCTRGGKKGRPEKAIGRAVRRGQACWKGQRDSCTNSRGTTEGKPVFVGEPIMPARCMLHDDGALDLTPGRRRCFA
jgi:hypothetical protein